ncbi:MAG: phosphatase PAP2 family protein [Sediminibacterium sp.]
MLNQAQILYQRASNLTILGGLLLIEVSAYLGRIPVFLFLNTDGGAFVDQFFKWTTWGAEGWVWIPYLIVLVTWFKKDVKLIVLNFLLSTLITQISKHVIWDDITRPILSGIPLNQIHTVPGQVTHAYNSFPSGHTATAFTLFLLTLYFFPTKWTFAIGFIYAMICAYSRVYLGQHFPMDLGGGMLVAVLSMQLSILIRQKISNR